jgi:hypothetical protein
VTAVGVLEFGWWDVSAVFVEASVVEPVDPFQGGDLAVVGGAPGPSRFDQFGLVEAVDSDRRHRHQYLHLRQPRTSDRNANGASVTTNYGYDLDGNLTSLSSSQPACS